MIDFTDTDNIRSMSKVAIPQNLVSVNNAAEKLGVTTGRIRQMLRSKILTGIKLSERAWVIDPKSLEKATKEEKTVGRPRSGKK